jgi:hypothetical protein
MVILLPFFGSFQSSYSLLYHPLYLLLHPGGISYENDSKELTFVCMAKATFGEFQVHLDDRGNICTTYTIERNH